jgi:hypothetical protein
MNSIEDDRWTESSPIPTFELMNARITPQELDRLAHRIANDGIAAHEPFVQHVARRAATFGLAPTPTAILADRTAPPVVRERAFARVVEAFERERQRSLLAA